jgi:outer membrane protein OmpA-like peptidoglycan-associated protein
MADDLLDAFHGLLTPELIGRMASTTGESETGVSKALMAAAPLMISGLVQRSGEPGRTSRIMGLLTGPAGASNALGNLGGLLAAGQARSPLMEAGSGLLTTIFGNQLGAVSAALAQYAGIRGSSASSLLGYAAPILIALLGDRVRKEGWSAGSLFSWLAGQRDAIASTPPSLANAAGWGHVRDGGSVGVGAPPPARPGTASHDSVRWLWPAALGLLLALGGLWALRSRPRTDVAIAPEVPGAVAARPEPRGATAGISRPAELGALVKRRLPNSVELDIPARGVESQVLVFIEDESRSLEPPQWFNFDRLAFETGSATLKPESQEQLRNLAEILKAYPTVHMRIGGYTDNTGNPEANLKLSQDRATSVENELVRLGIAPDRLTAEGYGEQYPVADNSTETGRAANRRTALRLTQR